MKKTATLGALLLALALPLAAQAETVFAGEVTAGTTQVIAAPYGGLVEDVRVRVGDSVKIGDPIATVETRKTYASTDGTVSGVCARRRQRGRRENPIRRAGVYRADQPLHARVQHGEGL